MQKNCIGYLKAISWIYQAAEEWFCPLCGMNQSQRADNFDCVVWGESR
jgi:hypothetical protein